MNVTVEIKTELTYTIELTECVSLQDAEDQALALVEEHLADVPEAVADVEMDIYEVDSYGSEEE